MQVAVHTTKLNEQDLFQTFSLDKGHQIIVKDYNIYPVDKGQTLVLFPSNILQELWDCPTYDVVKAITDGKYNTWVPKMVYEIIDEKILDQDTKKEIHY